jgi:hypothetical protein
MKRFFIFLILLVSSSYALEVGIAHKTKVILPSKDWGLTFIGDDSELDLRLIAVEASNDGFEYRIEVIANEAGRYNVLDYLRSPLDDQGARQDPIWMEFETILPLKFDGELRAYKQNEIELSPWYQSMNRILMGLWLLGLCMIIFIKKKKVISVKEEVRELTLAQYLLSRLEQLNQGKSNKELWQEVELSCIQFCREQLNIQDLSGAEVFAQLKAEPNTSVLILNLEKALHAKGKMNIQSLLNQIRDFTEQQK